METMELLLILLILLCVLVTAADGNSPAVIKVKEDSDVVLPCSLSSKENLESKLFDWKKDVEKGEEKRVFMYNGGIYSGRDFEDQDKHFEGRVSHFPHELKNGNASIKITKTKVSDSGTYTCIFPRLQPSQTVSIQLVVECILKDRTADNVPGACPEPSVTTLKVTKDQALLQCVVRGASPKPVVQWRNSSGNILSAEETKVQQKGDSFDLVLQSNVTKSGRYSCVITQNDICHQISSDIDVDIHVSGPPVGWIIFVVIVAVVFIIVVVLGFRKVQALQEQMQILKDQVQSLQECPHQPGSGIL